jgi:DNA polymerase-1
MAKLQRTCPLLVVDGDSLAHRAYHALPKSIVLGGGRSGGAIVGFANFILRLYQSEQHRAVLVGWDTLDAPTYRHNALPDYQSGRHFDRELLEQLELLPRFVSACGFANGKAPGYEADDFLASAVAREEQRGPAFQPKQSIFGYTDLSRRWMPLLLFQNLTTRNLPGTRPPPSRASGS